MIRALLGLAVLGLATSGCVVYSAPPPRRVVVVRREYPAQPAPPPASYDDWPSPSEEPGTTTVVESEPPPVRYEVVTESPGVDFVWVGGYWAWRGGWVWCPGRWHHGPRGYGWRSGVWSSRAAALARGWVGPAPLIENRRPEPEPLLPARPSGNLRLVETEPLSLAPKRVLALGLTWRDHARETGERISRDGPARFERDPASLVTNGRVLLPSRARVGRALDALEPGLGDELARRHPQYPHLLDYEVELAFVALAGGRTGWFLANDVTVRTVQILGEGSPRRMDFWTASKSFPATLVVGSRMVIADETPDVELVLRVGEDVRQHARSTELLYTAAELRRFAGPLEPGDVVLTGTPAGVALFVPRWKRILGDLLLSRWGKLAAAFQTARGSGRFLRAGDVIDMDAGPLGRARAVVEQEREEP